MDCHKEVSLRGEEKNISIPNWIVLQHKSAQLAVNYSAESYTLPCREHILLTFYLIA